MEPSPLHERLRRAAGRRSFRAIASETGFHAETVRRYLSGQAPSVEFLAAVCKRFDVSADWLLTGAGAMRPSERKSEALAEANPAELLSAIAATLETIRTRVDRVETYLHTLETRLRARAGAAAPTRTNGRETPHEREHAEHAHHPDRGDRGEARDAGVRRDRAARARLVADALAE